jgi:hypothetical protein
VTQYQAQLLSKARQSAATEQEATLIAALAYWQKPRLDFSPDDHAALSILGAAIQETSQGVALSLEKLPRRRFSTDGILFSEPSNPAFEKLHPRDKASGEFVEKGSAQGSVAVEDKPRRRFTAQADADQWTRETFKDWGASLTDLQREALDVYRTMSYRGINGALRTGVNRDSYREQIKALDDVISRATLPEDVTVFRGLKAGPLLSHLTVGSVFEDRAFVSTSLSDKYARDAFVVDALVEIRILPRGTRFKILESRKEGKLTYLVAEVVPDTGSVGMAFSLSAPEPSDADRFVWEESDLVLIVPVDDEEEDDA